MDSCQHETAQRLSDIVASRTPWFRTRLSTIMVWPTIRRDWVAVLSYAHYTTLQLGETAPHVVVTRHLVDNPLQDGQFRSPPTRDCRRPRSPFPDHAAIARTRAGRRTR